MFVDPSREALRRSYLDAWRKSRASSLLTPLEAQIANVIREHPEYHALIEHGSDAVAAEFPPELGRSNPFLHMGLHLALRDQVATNRPAGIAAIFSHLLKHSTDMHAAEHRMIEPLAAAMWEAQRANAVPDEQAYLEKIRRL